MKKFSFTKARRKGGKLRLALTGPAGSGKTYSALLLARGLGGRVAVLDTEGGSASLYADLLDFDTLALEPPYLPEDYVQAIAAAEAAGYDTLIIDSLSHEWEAMITLAEEMRKQDRTGNSMLAWAKIMPRHKRCIAAILNSGLNIIATMRVKSAYVEVEGANGRTKMVRQGTKIEQKDGTDYEFAVVFELSREGNLAWAGKDRTRLFQDESFRITEDTGRRLAEWLDVEPERAELEQPTEARPKEAPELTPLRREFYAEMGRRHGKDKAAILSELSDFFGRPISNGMGLSEAEVSEWLDAVRENREEVEA